VLALAGAAGQSSDPPHVATSRTYRVRPGDTIDGLATRFGVQPAVLAKVNHLSSADSIQVGQTLLVPSAYHPNRTRSLIEDTALRYGVDPALASAVAWQESGFNENVRSSTGAIGVMQVEPGTADLVARQLGRSLNLADENDNVTAGVYWLAYLHRFYGGDDARAVAAYYEGQGNLASYGYLAGTSEYVANVMALRSSFASDRPVR
jgi:soluble lytic murein transglycosylase-like protein